MKKRNTKQVILPLITSFIWGSSFVAQSLGAGKVGGFTFTASRSIPAVLVLGALVLILRRVRHEEKYTPQQKKDLLEGGLVCGIFLTLGTNLQQFGIADTTAGKAGFITALYIVLVPLAGMFLGKKANKRLFLCVLIAVVGLYFLCFTGSEGAMSFGRGDFLVFLCAFAFTGHILCVDHYVQKVDGIGESAAILLKLVPRLCHKARLAVAEEYAVKGYDALYGFIAGMCAGNYDITDIFVDSTLKIGGGDLEGLADFIEKLGDLSKKASTNMVLSISADKADIPERIAEYAVEL